MPVTITKNDNIEERVERVKREIADGLSRVLPQLRAEIIERTQSGRDANGSSFARYSDSYAKAKAAAIGSSSPVNLTLSGDMLGSISTSVRNDSSGVYGIIQVNGQFNRDKARWNQGGNPNIPERRFMALSDEQRERLNAVFRDAINRAVRT